MVLIYFKKFKYLILLISIYFISFSCKTYSPSVSQLTSKGRKSPPKLTEDDMKRIKDDKKKNSENILTNSQYLILGTYTAIDPVKGPSKPIPYIPQGTFKPAKPAMTQSICINYKKLNELFESYKLPLISPDSSEWVPVSANGQVDNKSVEYKRDNVCYVINVGEFEFSENALPIINEVSRGLFKGFKGINELPMKVLEELIIAYKISDEAESLPKKVERLEKLWTNLLPYKEQAPLIYTYDEKITNMIEAGVKWKMGNCLSHNFSLGTSIYQLSSEKIPIRFNLVLWLQKTGTFSLDNLHLQTQYFNGKKWISTDFYYFQPHPAYRDKREPKQPTLGMVSFSESLESSQSELNGRKNRIRRDFSKPAEENDEEPVKSTKKPSGISKTGNKKSGVSSGNNQVSGVPSGDQSSGGVSAGAQNSGVGGSLTKQPLSREDYIRQRDAFIKAMLVESDRIQAIYERFKNDNPHIKDVFSDYYYIPCCHQCNEETGEGCPKYEFKLWEYYWGEGKDYYDSVTLVPTRVDVLEWLQLRYGVVFDIEKKERFAYKTPDDRFLEFVNITRLELKRTLGEFCIEDFGTGFNNTSLTINRRYTCYGDKIPGGLSSAMKCAAGFKPNIARVRWHRRDEKVKEHKSYVHCKSIEAKPNWDDLEKASENSPENSDCSRFEVSYDCVLW